MFDSVIGGHITVVGAKQKDLNDLVNHLEKEKFKVKKFQYARDLIRFLKVQFTDLIIISAHLADKDGLELCRVLKGDKGTSFIPIILLTTQDAHTDKVLGLECGADDCVSRDVDVRELVARAKKIIMKDRQIVDLVSMKRKIKVLGDILVIDAWRHEVTVDGKEIDLTSTEFKILQILSERKGWVFTRNQILTDLSGDKDVWDRTIDVHITRLRSKLGKAGKFIKTVRGVGYKLQDLAGY